MQIANVKIKTKTKQIPNINNNIDDNDPLLKERYKMLPIPKMVERLRAEHKNL
jgi:hypothetical protein